jgi:tricorn protease
VVALLAAPSGRRLAISNHRNEVFVGDLDKGTLQPVDRSECGRTEDLAWSPDGAWLAYTFATSPRHTAIKLFELATAQQVPPPNPSSRTTSVFRSGRPVLYFLSLRTFDPVYDSVQFE